MRDIRPAGDRFTRRGFIFVSPCTKRSSFQVAKLQRQIADFIEKKRAAITGGDAAGVVFYSAGESALCVAEEFALQEMC